MFPKPARWQSPKYRSAAKDQPCTMRLSGICNGRTDTTVLAHANGGGMGTKADDFNAADMCSDCHNAFDGVVRVPIFIARTLQEEFERARFETIANRLRRGVLK